MGKLLSTWPGDRGQYGCTEQADKIHFIPEEYAFLDFLFEQETENNKNGLIQSGET